MEKYRIKEKYKHLWVGSNTFFQKNGVWFYTGCDHAGNKVDVKTHFTDEMFEKVEEGERLQIVDGNILIKASENAADFTEQERKLCEGIINVDPELAKKFLNGDMVENDKPIENQYFNREEYGFNVKDGVLTVYPLNTGSSDDEPITDGRAFRRDEYKKEREAENEGDTYILKERGERKKDIILYEKHNAVRKGDHALFTNHEMINMMKVLNGDLHTSEQMIEKVKQWQTSRHIGSFEKFVNGK